MRLHLAVSALGALAVGVATVQAQSRTTFSGLGRRDTTDTCSVVESELEIAVDGELRSVGQLYACACLSTISTILTTNSIAIYAVSLSSETTVSNLLQYLIESEGTACTYPTGAIATCEANNVCAYSCSNGFSVSQTGDCVCESPNVVCNGQCASSCPSSVAVAAERRAAAPFDRVANRRRMCPRGFIPCGIFEQRGQVSEPWDCVDVRYELESCGGCMTPFDDLSPRGVDCTALPGVADVSCMRGSCVIRRCTAGYAVTADHSQCVRTG